VTLIEKATIFWTVKGHFVQKLIAFYWLPSPPQCGTLIEKPAVTQMARKLFTFLRTGRFITVFTSDRY
jgi:hypothetical protein